MIHFVAIVMIGIGMGLLFSKDIDSEWAIECEIKPNIRRSSIKDYI